MDGIICFFCEEEIMTSQGLAFAHKSCIDGKLDLKELREIHSLLFNQYIHYENLPGTAAMSKLDKIIRRYEHIIEFPKEKK